MNNVIVKYH